MVFLTNDAIEEFFKSEPEPSHHPTDGEGYRCSADLRDGTHLPCVIIRHNKPFMDRMIQNWEEVRINETRKAYRDYVTLFFTTKNVISYFDIEAVGQSRYATPRHILDQIETASAKGLKNFVLEMSDGAVFTYRTIMVLDFLDVPEGYGIDDIVKVHDHSFVGRSGDVVDMKKDYITTSLEYGDAVTRAHKPHFECYVDRP